MKRYTEPSFGIEGASLKLASGSFSEDQAEITWEPSYLIPRGVRQDLIYARHLTEGFSMLEAMGRYSPALLPAFEENQKKIKRHERANEASRFEGSLLDSLPDQILSEMILIREALCNSILSEESFPENYDQQVALNFALSEISQNTFMFGEETVSVSFDPLGSATGRLKLRAGSFPILNLAKERRELVRPHGGILLDLDFNALDLRIFLALLGIDQPKCDPHDENAKFLKVSRGEAKVAFFSWLYGSTSEEAKKIGAFFENEYACGSLLDKFYDGQRVRNPFGRVMECESRLAMNRLIQSTSADVVHQGFMKVHQALRGDEKRGVLFLIHDSVTLALPREQLDFAPDLCDILGQTALGKLPVRAAAGPNFGHLERIL